ncbi:MAG: DinB family protein [Bryobacteraceae bacterium]
MEFRIEEARQILERTPAVVSALLSGVSGAWKESRERPETFSPVDVLGHLIHGEQTDWIPRLHLILESGEATAFEPYDHAGYRGVIQSRSVQELLNEFAHLRKQGLQTLATIPLDSGQLEQTGTHPALGRVTLRNLLASWVMHDLGHISQMVRIMARQYGDAVGPWREYMSILTR